MRDNLILSNTLLLNAVSVLMVSNQCMFVPHTHTHTHTHARCVKIFTPTVHTAHSHIVIAHTHACTLTHTHSSTIAPVAKSGDTMLGLAVCKGQLDINKYVVTECSVSVNGEQSVYVSPAICGVCEHTLPAQTTIRL